MRSRIVVAPLVAAALGCAAPPRAPVALGRPAAEAGAREFLLDDLLFTGPDWPLRVEGSTAIVEEDGPCRQKRFVGAPANAWISPRRGLKPGTSCTFIAFAHAHAQFRSNAECEQAITDEVPFGAFRYASQANRSRVDLGGRLATEDDLRFGAGSEARRYVSYALCRDGDLYAITVGGLDARWDEVERIRARLLASSRWVDPAEAAAAAAGATAPPARPRTGR
jgi:hypothetical protein